MNKKQYIAPAMEIAELEIVEMLAASTPKIDIDFGGSGEEILTNDRRGTWGNLWNNK